MDPHISPTKNPPFTGGWMFTTITNTRNSPVYLGEPIFTGIHPLWIDAYDKHLAQDMPMYARIGFRIVKSTVQTGSPNIKQYSALLSLLQEVLF